MTYTFTISPTVLSPNACNAIYYPSLFPYSVTVTGTGVPTDGEDSFTTETVQPKITTFTIPMEFIPAETISFSFNHTEEIIPEDELSAIFQVAGNFLKITANPIAELVKLAASVPLYLIQAAIENFPTSAAF